MKTREYQYDNLRFLLIALVVLGHLLEIAGGIPGRKILYDVIYSFHMPAFLFLSGMFARLDRGRFLFGLCLPYLALQMLYLSWARLLGEQQTQLEFARPYWLLWYLFALMVYHVLLPIYDTPSRQGQVLLVAGSFALALLAGFDRTIGYPWSASRVLVFQPWFLMGFYFRRQPELLRRWQTASPVRRRTVGAVVAALWLLLEWLLLRCRMPEKMLYGAQDYYSLNGSWPQRLLSCSCAAAAIFLLFVVAADKLRRPIPLVTRLGQNTLSVYLLHGLFVLWLRHRRPEMLRGMPAVLLVWAALLVLLGSPWVGKEVRFVCGGWYVQLRNSQIARRAGEKLVSRGC